MPPLVQSIVSFSLLAAVALFPAAFASEHQQKTSAHAGGGFVASLAWDGRLEAGAPVRLQLSISGPSGSLVSWKELDVEAERQAHIMVGGACVQALGRGQLSA